MKNIIYAIIVIALMAVVGYYAYDTLRERTYEEKIAEIIHLEDSRDFGPALKNYLEDSTITVRARAALAIGRISAPDAAETLFELITSEVDDVAAQAAFAIGLTDKKEYAARLLDIAFDAPSRVGAMAVASAGRIADSTMTDVHKLLTTFFSHPSPEVRKEAVLALFRSNGKSQAPALMNYFNQEKDDDVIVAALYTLTRLRIKEAYNTYVTFLSDADPYVRMLALRGVGLSDNKGAIHYLTIALNDSDERVVAQAISLLAQKTDDTSKKKLSSLVNKLGDKKLIVLTIDALLLQNNDMAVNSIKNLVVKNQSPNVVAAAVKYLAATEQDKSVMLIDSLMRVNNPTIRTAAAEAFGIINSPNNIPRLSILFSDKDITVRASAFGQLLTLDSANLKFYLDQALSDSNYILRTLAIDEIASRKLVAYLPKLREISINSTLDDLDLRRTLANCAGQFLEKNKTDSNALRILINASLDKDYIVRKEAVEVYKNILDEERSDLLRRVTTRYSASKIESALKKYKSNPYAKIVTNKGTIDIELYFDVAPLTVMNFIELAKNDFYEKLIFHRIIPNFVAQGGDPEGTGWGGPDYQIRCEYSNEAYRRGTVGVATSGKDTGGSQFFITYSPQPHLEGRYTVFGQVLYGMDVVDQLVIGDTIKEITIEEGKQI